MNIDHGSAGSSAEGMGTVRGREPLGGFEKRLLAELKSVVAQQPAAAGQPMPSRGAAGEPHHARRRLPMLPALMSASGVAVGAAVMLVIVASGSPRMGHTVPGASGPPSASASFGQPVSAAVVLHNAALAALELPAAPPRPDQFVYSEVVQKSQGWQDVQQQWTSADGTRFGLSKDGAHPGTSSLMPACRGGLMYDPKLEINPPLPIDTHTGKPGKAPGYHTGPVHCTTADTAGYLPGMQATPRALGAYLRGSLHDPVPVAGALLYIAEQAMLTDYLLPQQRAALYEFLAGLPGLTMVPHVTNMQGTPGIGVRVTGYKGGDWTIVFDPKNYDPLGMVWNLGGKPQGEMQVRLAIVNKAGQLP